MEFTVVATNGGASPFRVAPAANDSAPVPSAVVAWAAWLSVPLLATVLAALWTWVRGRPPGRPGTAEAIREHQRYLDALALPARGTARPAADERCAGSHMPDD